MNVNGLTATISSALWRRITGALIAVIMALTFVAHGAHALAATSSASTIAIEIAGQPGQDAPDQGKIGDQCQSHPSATVIASLAVVTVSKAPALRPVTTPAALTPADRQADTPPPRG